MARAIERTAKNGAKSWLVKWRIGGGRNNKEDFETCYDRQVADDFASLVTLSGENRPHGYPKGCHGIEDPNYDPTHDPEMPSFEQYARHNYATRLGASPTQRATYLAEAQRHVFPRFGHLPLDQVTRRVLREWVEWMLTKPSAGNQHQPRAALSDEQAARRWAQANNIAVKTTGSISPEVLRQWQAAGSPQPAPPDAGTLSAATVAKVYRGAIKPVFQAALHQGEDGDPPLLTSSPCTGFRLPTAPIATRAVLYGPEVALYLKAVHDIDPDTALFIITEMATGLRWGETAGLHVSHLDPAGRQLHIVQTYAYLLDETTGRSRWQIKPYPKGKKQRIVPISPGLAALLTRRTEGCHADQPLFREPYRQLHRLQQPAQPHPPTST